MMCVDMIVFVIILHGLYSAGIYGVMFSSVLENSLSPAILLKALLRSSASQPHVSFQLAIASKTRWLQRLASLSVSSRLPTPAISHCHCGSPKALKPTFYCSVFLVLSKVFGLTT